MDTLASGTVVASRYTVVQVVGQGGMAVVYEVMNHKLGTTCALKVLTLTARSVRKRLEKEGRVQAELQHPNILSVFDVVDVDGAPGLLMELVRGPPLDRLLEEQALTFDQCDALAQGIFAGMEAAHERGLIHRDLKPANILCSIANGQLIPKIADFGLAKVINEESGASGASNTKSGTTMGTPSYMAPEQIRNAGKVDQRADIFSLGAILYEMVCGRKAFGSDDDLLELFTAVAAGRYTPPRELRPDLPERMERAIVGALTPNRDERIRDIATLAAVWNGDRDEWTKEFDPRAASVTLGPWDATLLSRYTSNNTSGSGERTPGGSGQGLTPMSPSARGPVSGVTYTEELGAPAAAPRAAPVASGSRRSLAPTVAGSALALLLAALALGGASVAAVALAAWFALREDPVVATAPEPAPAPVVAPAPPTPVATPLATPAVSPPPTPVVVAEVPAPHPAPTAPHPAPSPDPPPAPAPVEVAPAPAPVEPPIPPGSVRVAVTGDARKVILHGADGNHPLPAVVPTGSYAIMAYFPGDDAPVQAGSLTVVAGASPTVQCRSAMRTCK